MRKIFSILIILLALGACTDEKDLSFLATIEAPTNVDVAYEIKQDNTGVVNLIPSADGASTFTLDFGDGTTETVELKAGESTAHTYGEGVYNVIVKAVNLKGDETTLTKELIVSFKAPENLSVKAEVDSSNPFILNVSATADFATSFMVFFDALDPEAEGVLLSHEAMVSFEYPAVGDYTVRVVALSGGTETSELEEVITIAAATELPIDFEIFDESVFVGFGGASNAVVDNPDMDGNSSEKVSQIIKNGPEVWAGNVITLSSPIDFSNRKLITMDVWSPRPGGKIILKIENLDDDLINIEKEITTTGNSEWETVTFDVSDIDTSQTYQKLVFFFDFGSVGDGSADWTFYIDNIKLDFEESDFDDGLLVNGDFELGTDSWIEGTNDTSPIEVTTNGDNTFYSVNVAVAGNPWEVNMSQKVEIIQGNTYTLTFDAWSDQERTIISGIGLSVDPFSSAVETINITSSIESYSITLVATDFGAIDARVLFDLGADTGEVNIDNVSLIVGKGNFILNGDFELGSDSWIEGTNDASPIEVTTNGGNTYYSVNVTTAGNPWDVNISQKVEIIQGNTYTLTFDAWSDQDRTIISGIGLSVDPFSSAVETINITSSIESYSITLVATDFGAIDARVLFDLGADSGEVNIDNVHLSSN